MGASEEQGKLSAPCTQHDTFTDILVFGGLFGSKLVFIVLGCGIDEPEELIMLHPNK